MNFDDLVIFRLRSHERRKIEDYVSKNPDEFDSVSHFLRAAVIRALREKIKNMEGDAYVEHKNTTTE